MVLGESHPKLLEDKSRNVLQEVLSSLVESFKRGGRSTFFESASCFRYLGEIRGRSRSSDNLGLRFLGESEFRLSDEVDGGTGDGPSKNNNFGNLRCMGTRPEEWLI